MTVRFVVLTPGRSGSQLLRSYLNAHPRIRCHGELFNLDAYRPGATGELPPDVGELLAAREREPEALLRRLLDPPVADGVSAIGFVVLYRQGGFAPGGELWRSLLDMSELRVIHLVRLNLLRRYFSLRKAVETGLWAPQRNDEARDLRLTLRFSQCIADFWAVSGFARAVQTAFGEHQMLSVAYERLVSAPGHELARLQRFLGVDVRSLNTGAQKQASIPLRQAIVNFHELRESFAGSEWSWFFDDRG